ncbi:hypothetical protein [Azospirillum formosense]|nr:hypothetical protein [Azospirillum formosense]
MPPVPMRAADMPESCGERRGAKNSLFTQHLVDSLRGAART